MIRVAVQTRQIGGIEHGFFVFIEMPRGEYSTAILRDVTEIAGRREMAEASDAPMRRTDPN